MQLKLLDTAWRMLGNEVDPRTGFSINVSWCSEVWAWGWFDVYVPFGLGIFVAGPVHIRVTWPLPSWPNIAASSLAER